MKNKISVEDLISKFRSVQLEPIEPIGKFKNSKTKWKARCKICDEITVRSLNSLLSTGTKIGCLACSLKLKSKNQLLAEETVRREFLRLGLTPIGPYPGSQKNWESICTSCQRQIFRSYGSLRDAVKKWGIEIGCPYCNGNRVVEGEVSMILEQYGLSPIEDYSNNWTSRLYRCMTCGAETRKSFTNIRRMIRSGSLSYGCPQCSLKAMGQRKAESQENASGRFLEVGLRLIGTYENARKSVSCECLKCGAITKQTLNGVKNGKTCKFCAKKGIQLGEPAYLYLITNSLHNSIKIGIGNIGNTNDRLLIHYKHGWALVRRWDFQTGEAAEKTEKRILAIIRLDKSIPPHLSKEDMPQGGWSETIDADSISIHDLEEVINLAIDQVEEKSSPDDI